MVKVKIKCKKCGYIVEAEIKVSPLGSLKPTDKQMAGKIDVDKNTLDKILDISKGASYDDLEKLGLPIELGQWKDAQERREVREFIKENIKVSKEHKSFVGEKYVITNEPWKMGDSFRDVDLPSSEIKSMGMDELRMIPGVTLQKKVFGTTKGRDIERLKGIKFICLIDVSGSMIEGGGKASGPKIEKALLVGSEVWKLCNSFGYSFSLAVFSDHAERIPDSTLKKFWEDSAERAEYKIFNGGTKLGSGLGCFSEAEYKDANLLIISDMDIADMQEVLKKIQEIALLTNSFKIILIETRDSVSYERVENAKALFPNNEVKIMVIEVERGFVMDEGV
jgi:hypothetical protein